jgi:hypothetical protein
MAGARVTLDDPTMRAGASIAVQDVGEALDYEK